MKLARNSNRKKLAVLMKTKTRENLELVHASTSLQVLGVQIQSMEFTVKYI